MKYFSIEEFDCQETGENNMCPKFLARLDNLREVCGFPFYITSGYRSVNHSVERAKLSGGGTHTRGIAADIAVSGGAQRYQIQKHAYALGFTGIGVHRKFVHVDIRDDKPVAWPY